MPPTIAPKPLAPDVLAAIQKLGNARQSPILLLGESGTGKEVMAHAIHDASPVGTFVAIDCCALVGTLMESELFGYVRGAFTDARADKLGLIGTANCGTAFFDEIGDLPLDMQLKLLRLIQEREYRPIGALRSIPADIRVIAATWHDLPADIAAGKFRHDLYHRINVLQYTMLPLRERRDEIPGLTAALLITHHSLPGSRFSVEASLALYAYQWPGNVRELSNVVQHAIAMADGTLFELRDLPARLTQQPVDPLLINVVQFETLAANERSHILATLTKFEGNRGLTATSLGIDRSTLSRKLKAYGMGIEL